MPASRLLAKDRRERLLPGRQCLDKALLPGVKPNLAKALVFLNPQGPNEDIIKVFVTSSFNLLNRLHHD